MIWFILFIVVLSGCAWLIFNYFSKKSNNQYRDLMEKFNKSLDSQGKLTKSIEDLVNELRQDKNRQKGK